MVAEKDYTFEDIVGLYVTWVYTGQQQELARQRMLRGTCDEARAELRAAAETAAALGFHPAKDWRGRPVAVAASAYEQSPWWVMLMKLDQATLPAIFEGLDP